MGNFRFSTTRSNASLIISREDKKKEERGRRKMTGTQEEKLREARENKRITDD